MARLGRYFVRDQPLHVIQRGRNRKPIFFRRDDYARYRDWLAMAAAEYVCAIHAYVLMPNHVHLLVTPRDADSLPRMMQSLGRRYVRHVNAVRRRTGTLWDGRYRAAPIDSEAHLLACCRYIELNPVRAGMAAEPGGYRWSSWHAHAACAADPLLGDHALYRALAPTPAGRQQAYRALFAAPPDEVFVSDLRAATNGGWALGDERFKRQIAQAMRRRVAPLPKGRRRKPRHDARQINLL